MLPCDGLVSHPRGSRNTPSRFKNRNKLLPDWSPGSYLNLAATVALPSRPTVNLFLILTSFLLDPLKNNQQITSERSALFAQPS